MKRMIVLTFLIFGVAIAAGNKSPSAPSTTPANMGSSSMYSDHSRSEDIQAEEESPSRKQRSRDLGPGTGRDSTRDAGMNGETRGSGTGTRGVTPGTGTTSP